MKGSNPNHHGTRSVLRIFAITMALLITSVPLAAADDQQSPAGAQSDITHYIWLQNQDYSPGAQHTLYWSYDSGTDYYSKTLFFYLEKADGSGDRQYLNIMTGQMTDEAIDAFGNSPSDGFLFQVSGMGSINKLPLYTGSAPTEAGLWHWVAEVRDSTAKALIDSSWAKFVVYDEEVTLGTAAEGEEGQFITEDTTWEQKKIYRLRGKVFVESGVTLTIEAGTHILGLGSSSLFVAKAGSTVMARGTRSQPIVFGCDQAIELREPNCWSGVIILGNAISNNIGGTGIAEGVTAENGTYGGMDQDDNSGVFTFVRSEYAGFRETTEIEPNSWGFHGIGRGTTIDYIQAHWGKDDGIEFFGGSANANHMVITGANDDSLDWTDGWDGRVQHLYIAQDDTVECDEGNESDNNGDGNDFDPHSDPKIWNMTLVGAPLCEGRGLLLKEGTRARYYNSIITQSPGVGIQVSDTATCTEMNSGGMTFEGLTIWNNNGSTMYADQFGGDCDVASFMMTQANIITDMDPLLIRPEAGPQPKPFPQAESHVGMIGYSARPTDEGSGDTTAQYHGAFSPHPTGPNRDWIKEWANFIRPNDVE